jgi:putative glutamine amidotransferase
VGGVLIGVSASQHDFGDYGGVGMQRPLVAAGAVPVTFAQIPEAIDEALDQVAGVVLAPGRDMDPASYGQEPDPLLAPIEPRRDEFELALVPAALQRGLPILGVCRGMQVLNVALGGALIQDVRLADFSREHASDPGWKAWKRVERASLNGEPIPEHPRHPIVIEAPSILYSALRTREATVNSFHHQAVAELGEGLRATATAPDGVAEAIELDGYPALGVQFELQEEWKIDGRFTAVFDWFVAAAGAQLRGRRLSVS